MKKYDAKRDFGLKIWKIEEKCLNLQRSVLVVPEVIQTIRCFFLYAVRWFIVNLVSGGQVTDTSCDDVRAARDRRQDDGIEGG